VLMDLQMPVLDGLAATRQLRLEGSSAWVIALTASAFASDRQACADAGMNDHLSKPLLLVDLLAALRRAWEARLAASAPAADPAPETGSRTQRVARRLAVTEPASGPSSERLAGAARERSSRPRPTR
ncbi:MAG: response regulator, partial [Myxococcales bacterium]